MSCICIDNGLKEFPEQLGCLLQDNYGATHKDALRGFAKKRIRSNEEVTLKVLIKTALEMNIFAHWYYNEIDEGADTFSIEFPLFGMKRKWEVKLTNGLNEKLNGTAKYVDMKLKVITDVKSVVEDEISTQLCAICGG